MQTINHPIEDIVAGKSHNPEDVVADIMYILMRDLHLGYREIKKMPLEDIIKLIKRWKKEQKENEKAIKKRK